MKIAKKKRRTAPPGAGSGSRTNIKGRKLLRKQKRLQRKQNKAVWFAKRHGTQQQQQRQGKEESGGNQAGPPPSRSTPSQQPRANGKARKETPKEVSDEEGDEDGFCPSAASRLERMARLQEYVNQEAGTTTTATTSRAAEEAATRRRDANLIKDSKKLKALRTQQDQDTKEINKLARLLRMTKNQKKKVAPIFADEFASLLHDIEGGEVSRSQDYKVDSDGDDDDDGGFEKDLAYALGKPVKKAAKNTVQKSEKDNSSDDSNDDDDANKRKKLVKRAKKTAPEKKNKQGKEVEDTKTRPNEKLETRKTLDPSKTKNGKNKKGGDGGGSAEPENRLGIEDHEMCGESSNDSAHYHNVHGHESPEEREDDSEPNYDEGDEDEYDDGAKFSGESEEDGNLIDSYAADESDGARFSDESEDDENFIDSRAVEDDYEHDYDNDEEDHDGAKFSDESEEDGNFINSQAVEDNEEYESDEAKFSDESEEDGNLIDSQAEEDDEADEESDGNVEPSYDPRNEIDYAFEGGSGYCKPEILKNGMENDIDRYSSNSDDDTDLEEFVVDDGEVEYDGEAFNELPDEEDDPPLSGKARRKRVVVESDDSSSDSSGPDEFCFFGRVKLERKHPTVQEEAVTQRKKPTKRILSDSDSDSDSQQTQPKKEKDEIPEGQSSEEIRVKVERNDEESLKFKALLQEMLKNDTEDNTEDDSEDREKAPKSKANKKRQDSKMKMIKRKGKKNTDLEDEHELEERQTDSEDNCEVRESDIDSSSLSMLPPRPQTAESYNSPPTEDTQTEAEKKKTDADDDAPMTVQSEEKDAPKTKGKAAMKNKGGNQCTREDSDKENAPGTSADKEISKTDQSNSDDSLKKKNPIKDDTDTTTSLDGKEAGTSQDEGDSAPSSLAKEKEGKGSTGNKRKNTVSDDDDDDGETEQTKKKRAVSSNNRVFYLHVEKPTSVDLPPATRRGGKDDDPSNVDLPQPQQRMGSSNSTATANITPTQTKAKKKRTEGEDSAPSTSQSEESNAPKTKGKAAKKQTKKKKKRGDESDEDDNDNKPTKKKVTLQVETSSDTEMEEEEDDDAEEDGDMEDEETDTENEETDAENEETDAEDGEGDAEDGEGDVEDEESIEADETERDVVEIPTDTEGDTDAEEEIEANETERDIVEIPKDTEGDAEEEEATEPTPSTSHSTTENDPQEGGSSRYIPPAMRKLLNLGRSKEKEQQLAAIKRSMKGLLNRLATTNMGSIATEIEAMYSKHGKNDTNEILTALLMEAVVGPALTPERLIQELAVLVALLAANVENEIGAYVLNEFVLKWQEELMKLTPCSEGGTKELENLTLFIAYLYCFDVVDEILIYDMLSCCTDLLCPKEVELVLLVLGSVGFHLRKANPTTLKAIIRKVQRRAAEKDRDSSPQPSGGKGEDEGAGYSRLTFLLETIQAIKNNNVSKLPNYDPAHADHLHQVLKGLLRKEHRPPRYAISLDAIIEPTGSSKWWTVGLRWCGGTEGDTSVESRLIERKFTSKFIKRACSLNLDRPPRINILYVVTEGSEDCMDAFSKIQDLRLPKHEEKELFSVILICCLKGRVYNPFFSHLSDCLCMADSKYRILLQQALQDKFLELECMSDRRVNNLAEFLSHLIGKSTLRLTIFDRIDFRNLDPQMLSLLRQTLISLLLHPMGNYMVEQIFSVLTSKDNITLRLGVVYFISKYIINKDTNDASYTMLCKRTDLVMDMLVS